MDDFKKLEDYYGFYKTKKLSNNQTISIIFFKNEFSKNNEYGVLLLIADKKKYIRQFLSNEKDILTDNQTGKCGLEGLIWAKKQLIEFENSECCKNGDIISIYWTDNRRRNTYQYGLKDLGYILGYKNQRKCLFKKIKKEN